MVNLDMFPDSNIAPENGWLKDYFPFAILNKLKNVTQHVNTNHFHTFRVHTSKQKQFETTKMGFTGVISPLQVELQLVTKPITYKVNSQPTPHKKTKYSNKKSIPICSQSVSLNHPFKGSPLYIGTGRKLPSTFHPLRQHFHGGSRAPCSRKASITFFGVALEAVKRGINDFLPGRGRWQPTGGLVGVGWWPLMIR